jgi:phosphatidate cytidylyltransferase
MAAASDATVPPLAPAEPVSRTSHGASHGASYEASHGASRGSLAWRILSALVLAPVAVAAVWFGWPWLPIVTALAGAVMAWEWARLCRTGRGRGRRRLGISGVLLVAAVVLAVSAVAAPRIGSLAGALVVSLIGAAIVFSAAQREAGSEAEEPRWLAVGVLWIALPCVLFLWLSRLHGAGRLTLLWIFAIVWATDIGAYAIGRRIGGPRLAPRWSPHKTWAGLVGGIVCAGLAGWGTASLVGAASVLPLVLVSAGLAIIEQFGDLAESVAKRRFGVKDSSSLIPGHGGLLDRLDGLLAVVPAVALLSSIGGGNVLEWR